MIFDEESTISRADEIFYRIGKFIWAPICLFGVWFARVGYGAYGELFACSFRQAIGIPCPGCGGTRAFYHLFQGNLVRSFLLHPAVVLGMAAYIHYMLLVFWRKHKRKGSSETILLQYYLFAAGGIIIGQWLFKLIYIFYLINA